MRILLFLGKGGVGKSTMASATAVRAASLGYRTVVISADPAHSVSDVLCPSKDRLALAGTGLREITENLWSQEICLNEELKERWHSITAFWSAIFRDFDVSDVLADELAILPGMEEMLVMLYLAEYHRNEAYDVAVVDCAPTAEALRFLSIPKTISWYMEKMFGVQRTVSKFLRPLQKYGRKIPIPQEDYFAELEVLYGKLEGVDQLLLDPDVTSMRLVALPEKIVLQETRRAFLYLCLYGIQIDLAILNRVLPAENGLGRLERWRDIQAKHIAAAHDSFAPLPVVEVPFQDGEPIGLEPLSKVAEELYKGADPVDKQYSGNPFHMRKENGSLVINIKVPFASATDIDVSRRGDELDIRIGDHKRRIAVPLRYSSDCETDADLSNGNLTITLSPN